MSTKKTINICVSKYFYYQLFQTMQKPTKVGKKYKIIKKIGEGSSAQIFLAINMETNLQVAIKAEGFNVQDPKLIFQWKLYDYLHHDVAVDKGFPKIYQCSPEGHYNCLVMDLMGPTLQDLFNKTFRKFSLKTVLMIADQMIERIEYIHKKNFVHRDIKPINLCIGLDETAHKIFMIDFGNAKKIKNKNNISIVTCGRQQQIGDPRFNPLNLYCREASPRGDMESLGYVLMYFLRGKLPWEGLMAKNAKELLEKIRGQKLETPIQYLCKGYPIQFSKYFTKVQGFGFGFLPNYSELRKMFRDLFERSGYEFDYKYDWVLRAQKIAKIKEKQESKLQL